MQAHARLELQNLVKKSIKLPFLSFPAAGCKHSRL
jgi:hypothetical protein